MALRITLEPGKRIIVNGAVIENTGSTTATLKLHNTANILRGSEVMAPSEVNTPARRLYDALQSAYLFESNRGEFLARFEEFADAYVEAAPSAADLVAKARKLADAGNYYGALKAARRVIGHEEERLALSPEPA